MHHTPKSVGQRQEAPPAQPAPHAVAAAYALDQAWADIGGGDLPRGAVVLLKVPGPGWHGGLACALTDGALGPHLTKAEVTSLSKVGQPAMVLNVLDACLGHGQPLVLLIDDERGFQSLPEEAQLAADAVLHVRALTWGQCIEVVEYGSDVALDLPDDPGADTLARLTPRHWLLAHREGQAGGDLLRRIISIASRASQNKRRIGVPTSRLESVPGMGREAEEWARTMVADLADYQAGTLDWADLDRGALLVGPPGCGKTSFAAALAGSAGVPLVATSYAEWQAAGHQGDMLKAMRVAFSKARSSAPCIFFLDELDSFGPRENSSGHNGDYSRQVVNGLLAELDGATERNGVVVVGATNDADCVDSALKRSGRLDRVITIPLPDVDALEAILRIHLGSLLVGESLTAVVQAGLGGSGADAARWCREAGRRARGERRAMMVTDLMAALPPRQEQRRMGFAP